MSVIIPDKFELEPALATERSVLRECINSTYAQFKLEVQNGIKHVSMFTAQVEDALQKIRMGSTITWIITWELIFEVLRRVLCPRPS